MPERPEVTGGVAIRLKGRWFCGFGRQGQVKTAWSLAGAKIFMPSDTDKIGDTMDRLNKKKKIPLMMKVMVSGPWLEGA